MSCNKCHDQFHFDKRQMCLGEKEQQCLPQISIVTVGGMHFESQKESKHLTMPVHGTQNDESYLILDKI